MRPRRYRADAETRLQKPPRRPAQVRDAQGIEWPAWWIALGRREAPKPASDDLPF